MLLKSSVVVTHTCVDGVHIFRSGDLPGLLVAFPDAQAAFDDVAPSIAMLLKLDHGVDVCVTLETPFHDFMTPCDSRDWAESCRLEPRRFAIERRPS